jgi:alpha-ketoglutarate-dependent taurine dioxygenase
VRSSQHFNLVQSFDGYVSEVYEWDDPLDKSKSSKKFNFHADGLYYKNIPEIIWLYCVRPWIWDNTTYLIDTTQALNELTPDILQVLSKLEYTYVWRDSKLHPRSLLEEDPLSMSRALVTNLSAKWFISPSLKHNLWMPELFEQQEATYALKQALDRNRIYCHKWQSKELLLVNNNRYLHGRNESAHGVDTMRFLYRFWLQYDKAWLL